jgi:hypothetical protein
MKAAKLRRNAIATSQTTQHDAWIPMAKVRRPLLIKSVQVSYSAPNVDVAFFGQGYAVATLSRDCARRQNIATKEILLVDGEIRELPIFALHDFYTARNATGREMAHVCNIYIRGMGWSRFRLPCSLHRHVTGVTKTWISCDLQPRSMHRRISRCWRRRLLRVEQPPSVVSRAAVLCDRRRLRELPSRCPCRPVIHAGFAFQAYRLSAADRALCLQLTKE